MVPLQVIIDTDISLGTPGAEIDDGAALIVLLNSPEINLKGISTVHGNVPVDLAVTNSRRILSIMDREDIPVARGCAHPLVEDLDWKAWLSVWQSRYGTTPHWSGDSEVGSAEDLLIETVLSSPGEVTLLALGPLTNLANAIKLEPRIVGATKQVVTMGGSFGKGIHEAEFNVRCDPEAAQMVFQADWSIRLYGLDITRRILFDNKDFASLPEGNEALTLLKKQARGWIATVEEQGWEKGGCALHDAIVSATLVHEDLCRSCRRH
jgi:inosine-uridine nucleoside N-ribohydrolase